MVGLDAMMRVSGPDDANIDETELAAHLSGMDAEGVEFTTGSTEEDQTEPALATRSYSQAFVQAAFKSFDQNDDGFIAEDEMERVLAAVGFEKSQILDIFAAADVNKDGRVDYDEFLAWIYESAVGTLMRSAMK